jgi:disulfide bond formation protein DsbB
MQLLSTFAERPQLLRFFIISSIVFLISAQSYDFVLGEVPCHLCVFQRVVLVMLLVCATISIRIQRYFMLTPLLTVGLVLSLRHAYVLIYPEQVTQCLPFELIMDLTGMQFLQALENWIVSIGRECSLNVGTVTYLLVAMLMVYYLLSLYLLSRERVGKADKID